MNIAYIILGMKRSGHHAIGYWIANNLSDTSMFFNDCCKGWGKKLLQPSPDRLSNQIEVIGNGKPKIHIFNIEDFNVQYLDKFDFRKFDNIKNHDKVYTCLVLRDPFNWVSSCLKTGSGLARRLPQRIKLWKRQAKMFLELKRHNHIIRVNYNEWFKCDTYRKSLSEKFGLKSHDKGIDMASPRGGGSSFDKLKFKNKASQMKVLERWKYFQGVEEYYKHFGPELHSYSERIFNFDIPDSKLKKGK